MLPGIVDTIFLNLRGFLRQNEFLIGHQVQLARELRRLPSRGLQALLGVGGRQFKFFIRGTIVFRFNLFLFLFTIYDLYRGQGSLRYFFTLGFLLLLLAFGARKVKIIVRNVVQVAQVEARRVEPLVAVLTRNHVVRFGLLADAVQLGRINWLLNLCNQLVVSLHKLLLCLREGLLEVCGEVVGAGPR